MTANAILDAPTLIGDQIIGLRNVNAHVLALRKLATRFAGNVCLLRLIVLRVELAGLSCKLNWLPSSGYYWVRISSIRHNRDDRMDGRTPT